MSGSLSVYKVSYSSLKLSANQTEPFMHLTNQMDLYVVNQSNGALFLSGSHVEAGHLEYNFMFKQNCCREMAIIVFAIC